MKLFPLELALSELPNSAINTTVPSSFQDFKHRSLLLLPLLIPQNSPPSNPDHPFLSRLLNMASWSTYVMTIYLSKHLLGLLSVEPYSQMFHKKGICR